MPINGGNSKTNAIYLGALSGGMVPTADLAAFESMTGMTFNALETFCNPMSTWTDWENPWQFNGGDWATWLNADSSRQLIFGMDLVPWEATGTTVAPVPNPLLWEQQGAAGNYNAHYTNLSNNLKSYGCFSNGQPFIIRLGIECNGNWEADWVGTTTQMATAWAQTFQQCVTSMRAVSGTNYLWCWNPNAAYSVGISDLNAFYPGDAYVDIIGIDQYDQDAGNLQTAGQEGWAALAANGAPSTNAIIAFANAHNKPIAFAEWGLVVNSDDPTYVHGLAGAVHNNSCAFQCYFNSGSAGVYKLNSTYPLSLAAYISEFSSTPPGTGIANPAVARATGRAVAPISPGSAGILNANWNFESDVSPWVAYYGPNGVSLAQSSAWAASGTYSAQVSVSAAVSYPGLRSESVAVSPGITYYYSTWLWSATGLSTGVQVGILWYDGSSNYLTATYITTAVLTASSALQVPSTAVTAPAGAATAVLFAQADGTMQASQTFNADVFKLAANFPVVAGQPAGSGRALSPTVATSGGGSGLVAEDASTPAVATTTGGFTGTTLTSASFSPPAGSTVVALCMMNYNSPPGVTPVITVSDSSGGGNWAAGPNAYSSGAAAAVAISIKYFASAPGAITVTMSRGSDTGQAMLKLVVRVLNGTASSQSGAGSNQGTGSAPPAALGLTTTRAGSAAYIAADMGGNTNPAANGSTFELVNVNDAADGGIMLAGRQSPYATGTPGAETLGWTGGEAGASWVAAALEVLSAASAAATTASPAKAAGTGAAPRPAIASSGNAYASPTPARGTGAAPQASVSAAVSGQAFAGLPVATGAARVPAAYVTGPVIQTFPGKPPNPLGIKAELLLGNTWTDITAYVMLRDQIAITSMGRTDEYSAISACQLVFTLRNDGRFTPRNASSPYYPYIVRNCPVRVSVNATSVTGVNYTGYRFCGEISAWPTGYDISQHDIFVQITASGIWRRVSQASVSIGSAYTRYVKMLTGTNVPAAYWSMEDGSGASAFVLTEGGGTNIGFTGQPSFAADSTSFGGSSALPQLNTARLAGNVAAGPTPASNVVRFAVSVPAAGDSTAATFTGGARLITIVSAGTAGSVGVSLISGQLMIEGFTSEGGTKLWTATAGTKINGIPVLVSVEITPSGGSINWALRLIKPGSGTVLDQVTGTRAASSIGAVTQIQVNSQGRITDTCFGQLGVWYTVPPLPAAAAALSGYTGEYAADRFIRLCTESNITPVVTGAASAQMGPQYDDTLANLLQDIEDTDGGMLYEPRDRLGLGYRTLASLKDQSASVSLPYSSGALGAPLNPTYDDQPVVNAWIVTNSDGYAASGQLTSGALSVLPPPNGVGTGYAKSKNINAYSHAQVNAIAQQLLFQGTVDDLRYPVVAFNLARAPAAPYFASVPGLDLGDLLQVTSLPAFLGAGTLKQLAWGYSEHLGGNPAVWEIKFNTIPELPFETGFSPGVWSVTQVTSGSVAAGSGVGSTVSGSQLGAGSVPGSALSSTISARSLGGITQYISGTTPYDWSFAVTGSPADTTYFSCSEDQAQPIRTGDTFTHSAGLGGPFTVTSADLPAAGTANIHFTPNATSVMSSGTVYGGKDGDQWINTTGGNQVNIWISGAWLPVAFGPQAMSFKAGGTTVSFGNTPPAGPTAGDLWYDGTNGNALKSWNGSAWVAYQFGTGAISALSVTTDLLAANAVTAAKITAGTITGDRIAAATIAASNIAAGTVIAGIVDGTAVRAGWFYGGGYFAYTGGNTPVTNTMMVSIVPGTVNVTDPAGNIALPGITHYSLVSAGNWVAINLYNGYVSWYGSTSQSAGWTRSMYISASMSGGALTQWQLADTVNNLVFSTTKNFEPRGMVSFTPVSGAVQPFLVTGDPYAGGTTLETWHDMRPLTNSFVGTISGKYPPQYRRTVEGFVEIFGNVQAPGTGNPNNIDFFQLPIPYRPGGSRVTNWPVTLDEISANTGAYTPRCEVDGGGYLKFHQCPVSYSSTPVFAINGRFPLEQSGLITS